MSPLDPGSVQAIPSAASYVAAWTQWLLAPLLATIVSIIYYRAALPSLSQLQKVLLSAHGICIAVLYMSAMLVFWMGLSKEVYATPFLFSLLVPVGLGMFSLFKYQGHKVVHWLQLLNMLCLAWTAFIGIMAVTGNWL
jgi:hypothetical protein